MVAALCYGSLNPDIVHRVRELPHSGDDLHSRSWDLWPGGTAANTAIPLASWGGRTTVLGNSLGDDALGRWILDDLAQRSIDVSLVHLDRAAATPHCIILLTPDGERTIISTGYDSVLWQDVPDDAWRSRSVAVVDSYSGPAGETVIREAARRSIPVVALDIAGRSAARAAIVVWSSHEHEASDARALSRSGPDVILTSAADLVVWFHNGASLVEVQPPAVEVVDATGAGDTLGAMIAFGMASQWSPNTTLRMAVAAAALVVQQPRHAPIPDLGTVRDLARTLSTRDEEPS